MIGITVGFLLIFPGFFLPAFRAAPRARPRHTVPPAMRRTVQSLILP